MDNNSAQWQQNDEHKGSSRVMLSVSDKTTSQYGILIHTMCPSQKI